MQVSTFLRHVGNSIEVETQTVQGHLSIPLWSLSILKCLNNFENQIQNK